MTNNFNQPFTQRYLCACFLHTISKNLGRVVKSDILMSSLGMNRDHCFVLRF